MSRWLALVVGLCLAAPASADTGAERLRSIRGIRFPAEQCYRVRDLFLEREDFKLHFSDGYLLFAEPVENRSLAALFLAATDTGEGEVILMPPTPSERQSMARFLGVPVLSENMRTTMMFFTDDTAEALRRAMAENTFNHADLETGKKLAPDWQPVARNLIAAYESRMLLDTLSPDLPAKDGFFAAAISGSKLGRFDILLDPRRTEQISVGQVVWQEGQRFYDLWTSFPARSFRSPSARPARKRVVDESSCEHYRIEASLSAELDMRVAARFSYLAGSRRERVLAFELSPQLTVTQVTWDGRAVEYLQNEPLDSSGIRRRGNGWLLVVLEEPAEPGSRHELEFQYQGNVITDAGKGVYYVGARGNWYPSRGFRFTDFDLLFHYPKRLQLVATGRPVENSVDAEVRTTRWKPDGPIRVAGFNLGNYERTSVKVGDYTLEVCANRNVEPALAPPLPPPLFPLPEPSGPSRRSPWRIGTLPTPESPPDPTRRLDDVTHDSADALQFFVARFGPLPLRQLTISPIPGRFGQGFPGLVYISTLSYYQ